MIAPMLEPVRRWRRTRRRGPWSVATAVVDEVVDPTDLIDLAGRVDTFEPTLTVDTIDDVDAQFVADPFLVNVGHQHHLFVEVLERRTQRGLIARATSTDGVNWTYRGVTLREPFHLSYPQVFEWDGHHWMLPETHEIGEVRLYRAEEFPYGWHHVATLLVGRTFTDATVVEHDGRWWMFSTEAHQHLLALHLADSPLGPWRPHPLSPLYVGDPTRTRPAGRMLDLDGRLVRLAQDGAHSYGRAVHAFEVIELTPTGFVEVRLGPCPLLGPSGRGFDAAGMHHLEITPAGQGSLVAVDGRAF